MPRFRDIPQFIDSASRYELDVSWSYLERFFSNDDEEIILDPDFQRGHVWTESQKEAYLEYRMRGGTCANNIIFACENFNDSPGQNPWYLVDGLQRVTAVQDFLANKVKAFGYLYSEYDSLREIQHRFHVKVVDTDRTGMLQLYLDLNAGGTPHAASEIDRVRKLLSKS